MIKFKFTHKDHKYWTVMDASAADWQVQLEAWFQLNAVRARLGQPHHGVAPANRSFVDNGPPALAEVLLVLLTDKRHSDALLGDLEERFHRDRTTRSLRQARLLYWARTLSSIRPLLRPAIKRLFTFVVGVVVGRTSG